MAPIHHHFEKKGWAEPQIVIRFWIIALILAMIGLATLKVDDRLKNYFNKSFVILGLGRSGTALAEALTQSGAKVLVWEFFHQP